MNPTNKSWWSLLYPLVCGHMTMTSEKSKRRHLGGVKTVMQQHAMPSFWLILSCSNDKKRRPGLRFRRVPKAITIKVNRTNVLSPDRRAKWLATISRGDLT